MARYVKPVAQQRATIIEPKPIKLSENLKKIKICRKTAHANKKNAQSAKEEQTRQGKRRRERHMS